MRGDKGGGKIRKKKEEDLDLEKEIGWGKEVGEVIENLVVWKIEINRWIC